VRHGTELAPLTTFARRDVKLADRDDEVAGIRQVQIVAALRDTGTRHTVVLALERARGVDDDIGRGPVERRSEVPVDVDSMTLGRIGATKPGGEHPRLCLCPSADQELDLRIRRKRPGDIAAEIAVAADDEDARYHEGFATMR
jgi:hypothetical protein